MGIFGNVRSRLSAGLGLSVLLTMLMGGIASASQYWSALTPYFRQVVTEVNTITLFATESLVYENLPAAGPADGAFAVVAAPGTLVTVRFTAESQCAGGGTDAGWCAIKILVNGTEAEPAPADFAFDSTNNGADGSASWEAHAMERHLCIAHSGAPALVPVQVQWAVFSADNSFPTFRLDDWSLTIESASAIGGCGPLAP